MSIHDDLDEKTTEKDDRTSSYLGNVTLAINKRFRIPITSYYANMYNKSKDSGYNIVDNFDFNIKFYFPRSEIIKEVSDKSRDHLHIIIMFNGLDESLENHYRLYDRLGASFAYYGITSVLLPTPFHLSRATKQEDDPEKIEIPSERLLKNPWLLPINFIQTMHEFTYLCKLINCDFDNIITDSSFGDDKADIKVPTDEDKDFYNLFFGKKIIDISVLGYSLGGLRALSCFKTKADSLKTCIVLNSGGTLKNLKLAPPLMENDKWQNDIVSVLLNPESIAVFKRETTAYRESHYYPIVNSILFQEDNVFDGAELDKFVSKLILVAGGKDRLVNPASVKRLETKDHGLNMLQIADLSHFIGDDPQFNRWYDRIIHLLLAFFEEKEGDVLSREASISLFLIFDFCCNNELVKEVKSSGNLLNLSKLSELVDSKLGSENKKRFLVITKALFAYFKKIEKFIKEIEKHKEGNYLYFCQNAVDITNRGINELLDIVETTESADLSGKKLEEAKVLLNRQIGAIITAQIKNYELKLDKDDTISKSWKQIAFKLLDDRSSL